MFRRACTARALLVGVCLWVVRRQLGQQPPTLAQFAAQHGISADTIRRAALALVRPALRLLRARRPGPRASARADATTGVEARLQACLACLDLLKSLLPAPVATLARSSAHSRGAVVQTILHWTRRGVPLAVLAGWLSLSTKTVCRWRGRLADHQVPYQSRRPDRSPRQLPEEIQRALASLRLAMPDLSTAELTKVFGRKFKELLARHGLESISEKTVGRYTAQPQSAEGTRTTTALGSPRGAYSYPPPLAMAWIDTSYLDVAGTTVHLVVAMEASSRVALAGDVFAQETAATTVAVLEQTLRRVPELSAVLRDRGRPYLNSVVNAMLAANHVLPIDAHPYFPIDKAALERFWLWLKEWLRWALALYVDQCRSDGRTPPRTEVVALVQPLLRSCLRAYNLLPQPYLEERSPIERIDRLLRSDGITDFSLSDLRRIAIERETKDDLLQQISHGLQLRPEQHARMRAEFALISRAALRNTLDAVGHRLLVVRDPTILHPYAYLLAVAKRKEDEHQRSCAEQRRRQQEQCQRDARNAAVEDAIRKQDDQYEREPEVALPSALRAWAKSVADPIRTARPIFARTLGRLLASMRRKVGAAFTSQIEAIRSSLPSLAAQVGRHSQQLVDRLHRDFDTILAATSALDSAPARSGSGQPPAAVPSCSLNRAHNPSPEPPNPHVSGTDVSP